MSRDFPLALLSLKWQVLCIVHWRYLSNFIFIVHPCLIYEKKFLIQNWRGEIKKYPPPAESWTTITVIVPSMTQVTAMSATLCLCDSSFLKLLMEALWWCRLYLMFAHPAYVFLVNFPYLSLKWFLDLSCQLCNDSKYILTICRLGSILLCT